MKKAVLKTILNLTESKRKRIKQITESEKSAPEKEAEISEQLRNYKEKSLGLLSGEIYKLLNSEREKERLCGNLLMLLIQEDLLLTINKNKILLKPCTKNVSHYLEIVIDSENVKIEVVVENHSEKEMKRFIIEDSLSNILKGSSETMSISGC